MDEQAAVTRVERTFWTVWNYISEAVTRFMRSEPAVNNQGNVEREVGQTVGFERAQRDPSQREDEEEEKKKEEEEQSDLNTASLPHCPQPPIALPPRTDTLLRDPGPEVQYTAVSARGSGIHDRPEQGNTHGVQWLNQTEGGRTEKAYIKLTAATQQTVEQNNDEKLLDGRSRSEESAKHQKPQQQQDTELSNNTDEENDHHPSGLEEAEKTLAADRPEDEAGQYSKVTEEEKARVSLSGDEEPDLNEPNNVSGLETEGHDIVREENLTCVNEENLERTEGGDTQKATSPKPENTDGGSAEHSASTLAHDQSENHLKSIEAVWEPDLTGIVSDEDRDEKADQEMTISDFVTPFVDSPEPNLSSLVSNDDNTVVGQERLEVEAKQTTEEVQFEMKEQSSFLIEGSDDLYRKGSYVIGPVGNQIVLGTKEETTKEGACRRVTVYVEETTPVKNQDDDQNDESQLQEEVNQTREEEEEEGAKEILVILQTAQDKEVNYSMKTEVETEFNSPEHLLCFGDTGKHDTKDSLSTSSDEEGDDGEGGVTTQWSVGIDSPCRALTVKAESNNEQEMSAVLQDLSPGTFPGSGARPHGLKCVPCEETRRLIPEENNGHFAAATENTEEIGLMGRDSEERWVASQLPHLSEGFNYVAGVGEVYHSQREDRDTTLKSGERENMAAGPDMVVGGSIDPESHGDRDALWGIKQQMSGRAVEATGEERRTGDGLSDEAHKIDVEDFKTEEPLFEFTLDGESSESTGAASEEAVGLENISSVWYDEVTAQDDRLLCEEILILPHAVIQKTTELCEGESTDATMTAEKKGCTLSQSEDYIEPESIHQPIDNQMRSFDDGQTKTEDIVPDISDEAMGHAGSEETTESTQQRNAGESNPSVVETVGPGSLTEMTSDLLMDIRQDLPDELQESTSRVTEPQTETPTQEIQEHMEIVSAVKAAEDEQALAFGQATETDEEILAMWVLPEDTDHTPAVTAETENQAVSGAETRTPSSSSDDDDDDDDEAADKMSKMHETPHHQPNFEEQIQDPDGMKEMSGQIEGEEDMELPLESYSCKSGLSGTLGISDILAAQECEDIEQSSGREGTPECEVLTTKPEGSRLPEMLLTAHLGAPDVSPHSFTEGRTPSPEQEPQHHPPSSGKLSDNEAVSSQAEQDESLCEWQTNEETAIKVEAIKIYPEVSAVAMSYDGATDDGSDETSEIPVPIPNSMDEDYMKPGVEDTSRLLPDMKLSETSLPPEVDSVVLREKKGFGESRQGPCLDSRHPLYKALLMNQAQSRRSELIASPDPGLSAEERARQRHSLPPGTCRDEFELDINVLDLTVQKSRILVKNPSTRPPTDPRALLQMPSLEPSPSHTSSPQRAMPLAGRPMGGIGVGIKLPGFGVGFPALKKTQKVVERGEEVVPEQQSELQQGVTMSPKPTVAERKPRWTPPKQPGFGNPLMSELKSKLKKTSEE
ncbi:unnamed protein product [Lota lota]